MAPNLDNERLLRVQQEAAEKGLEVGFQVKWEGATAGFRGFSDSHPAMNEAKARSMIASDVAQFGLNDEEFTLLPIAAQYVKP